MQGPQTLTPQNFRLTAYARQANLFSAGAARPSPAPENCHSLDTRGERLRVEPALHCGSPLAELKPLCQRRLRFVRKLPLRCLQCWARPRIQRLPSTGASSRARSPTLMPASIWCRAHLRWPAPSRLTGIRTPHSAALSLHRARFHAFRFSDRSGQIDALRLSKRSARGVGERQNSASPRDGEPSQATVRLLTRTTAGPPNSQTRAQPLRSPPTLLASAARTVPCCPSAHYAQVAGLFAPRGPLTLARPRACGPFRFAPRPNRRSPATLQILQPCGEPETATHHTASLPKKTSRPVSGVLSTAPAWHEGPAIGYDAPPCASGPMALLSRP